MTSGADERVTRRSPARRDPAAGSGGSASLPRVVVGQLGRRVADLVGDLADDLERTVSGAVEGAYVIGSAAVRDHCPGLDDVDLLVVLSGHPDALLGRLLDDVHQRVEQAHPRLRPHLVYTTWSDLSRSPVAPDAPGASTAGFLGLARRDGQTRMGPEHAPHAVTRRQLLDQGVAVIGPSVSVAQVAVTREELDAHCLREIAEHWTPWWERTALLMSSAGRLGLAPAVTDVVLRVARLHHTLLTGEVLGLTAVGQWALTVCEPEWTRLLHECLRVRENPSQPSLYRSPLARRKDALDFTDLLMTADEETFGEA